MKRAFSMMLVLALCLLGFTAAEVADVTGVWYLNIIEMDGMQLDPEMMGFEQTFTLNADGSAVLSSFDEAEESCSWSMVDGLVQISDPAGDTLVAVLEGSDLVIDDEETGVTMILGREKQKPVGYVPAAVEKNPAISDFEGSWNAALIDMMGMQVSMEAIGMKLVVEIAGDTAKVVSNESGADVSYEAPVTLEGDTLNVAAVDDQMPLNLQLQQDGKLVFAEESEGMAITMYFEKIA